MEALTNLLNNFSNLIYSWWAIPLLLVAAGLYLTIRTGLVQIVRFPAAVKMSLSGLFKRGEETGEGTITPFQALSTALASTVGNGNIGGVATAILVGGRLP